MYREKDSQNELGLMTFLFCKYIQEKSGRADVTYKDILVNLKENLQLFTKNLPLV